ncbi:hypothetical protein CC78DRAFT_167314 [Lojkania enalia]|uniref:Uncharacterized protein n=1 Tax=Lojkania enalia TaxID=147567 RepID=A0A9P4N5B0_9PLEO|nr:hypothetical protein CC78DRAFT_167314 [Didymosphaeria enalia]
MSLVRPRFSLIAIICFFIGLILQLRTVRCWVSPLPSQHSEELCKFGKCSLSCSLPLALPGYLFLLLLHIHVPLTISDEETQWPETLVQGPHTMGYNDQGSTVVRSKSRKCLKSFRGCRNALHQFLGFWFLPSFSFGARV